MSNQRLSVLHWESITAEIANNINNLPLAIGNTTADFETMDLITPNRLRFGRNNDRGLVGSSEVSSNPSKLLQRNKSIFDSWFQTLADGTRTKIGTTA